MELEIPHDNIVRYLGGEVNERVEHKIEELSLEAESLFDPDISYVHYPLDELQNLHSYKVSQAIRDCDQVVLFVATLGNKLDDYLHDLWEDNHYADAYVLDAIGSAGAETLVESFHEEFENYFQEHDRGVTLRFSPGYCDWSLKDQKLIFEEVDTKVELNESYLMNPSKSVSGLFGVTEEPCESITEYNPCLTCRKHNCQMKRKTD